MYIYVFLEYVDYFTELYSALYSGDASLRVHMLLLRSAIVCWNIWRIRVSAVYQTKKVQDAFTLFLIFHYRLQQQADPTTRIGVTPE